MLIGVISDTHDRLPVIDMALRYFAGQNTALIIHCGDWKSLETVQYLAEAAHRHSLPVRGVLGNNDLDVAGFLAYARTAPGDFELYEGVYTAPLPDGTQLAAYHGHRKPTLRKVLAGPSHSIVLLGHTHKPKIEHIDDKLVVNPGSTAFCIPRSKEWQPTIAIVDAEAPSAEIIRLR